MAISESRLLSKYLIPDGSPPLFSFSAVIIHSFFFWFLSQQQARSIFKRPTSESYATFQCGISLYIMHELIGVTGLIGGIDSGCLGVVVDCWTVSDLPSLSYSFTISSSFIFCDWADLGWDICQGERPRFFSSYTQQCCAASNCPSGFFCPSLSWVVGIDDPIRLPSLSFGFPVPLRGPLGVYDGGRCL